MNPSVNFFGALRGALLCGVIVAGIASLPASAADAAAGSIGFDRLRADEANGDDWLSYSGGYRSERFSPLAQIDRGNVAGLKVIWAYQMQPTDVPGAGLQETTPLVADGILYLTESPSSVSALDARTGRLLWHWAPEIAHDVLNIGFPRVNRGVALLGETLYVATLDARLVALDAGTGAERWQTRVDDNARGVSLTLAPLALDGKVIVGISGGEAGVRGYLDAYDAASGERLWRTYTVPEPGQPGGDTWGGESWRTGGGSTWLTGSFDPELNLLYWTTGNPAPDWNGDLRPGDNLYTCALLALDPDTGEMRWHFQFTPHDTHDWDANQIPVLVDLPVDGKLRKLIAVANRNAFYYLIDRVTGEFVLAEEYSKQTWAAGIDDTGRPILLPDKEPSEEGTLVWPSLQGATNWFSPSYNPDTGQFFVANRRMGAIYYKADAEYEEGMPFLGGGEQALSGDDASGAVLALDAATGRRQWEFPLQSPPWSGVMATAGALVFGSTNEGYFLALDAATGKPLWRFNTGAHIRTNPMAFAVDGRQRVAITGGRTLFVFGLE